MVLIQIISIVDDTLDTRKTRRAFEWLRCTTRAQLNMQKDIDIVQPTLFQHVSPSSLPIERTSPW